MFTQTSVQITGFDSTWQNEKNSSDSTTQTVNLLTKESSSNTSTFEHIGIQTEQVKKVIAPVSEDELNRLAVWLKKMCPKVLHELEGDSMSQAFRRKPDGDSEGSCKGTQFPGSEEENYAWNKFMAEEKERAALKNAEFPDIIVD